MSDAGDVPPAHELTIPVGVRWVKSTHSGPTGGNCVEAALLLGGRVAVRNSWHPAGPALVFPAAAWNAFVAAVRYGQAVWPDA